MRILAITAALSSILMGCTGSKTVSVTEVPQPVHPLRVRLLDPIADPPTKAQIRHKWWKSEEAELLQQVDMKPLEKLDDPVPPDGAYRGWFLAEAPWGKFKVLIQEVMDPHGLSLRIASVKPTL